MVGALMRAKLSAETGQLMQVSSGQPLRQPARFRAPLDEDHQDRDRDRRRRIPGDPAKDGRRRCAHHGGHIRGDKDGVRHRPGVSGSPGTSRRPTPYRGDGTSPVGCGPLAPSERALQEAELVSLIVVPKASGTTRRCSLEMGTLRRHCGGMGLRACLAIHAASIGGDDRSSAELRAFARAHGYAEQ